jgi:hypothetical protein
MNRLKDAEIAVEKYRWEWVTVPAGRKILMPPITDERFMWTAIWNEDGIPHYLPSIQKERQTNVTLCTIHRI